MDESVTSEFNPMSIKKGTQFIVMLIDVNSEEMKDFSQETPEQTKERFRKHLNSLINQLADEIGEDSGKFREKFKLKLKNMNLIKESTNELSIEGYAQAINLLKQKKNGIHRN